MSRINLKRNILMSGSFRIIIMLITFISSVISTRYLGVELKGQLSYLITMSGFIWMALDLGLYRSFPYLVQKYPNKVSSLFSWILSQFAINSIILISIGLFFLKFWNSIAGYVFSPFYIVSFVLLITFTQIIMQLQSLYLGLDKIYKHSIIHLFKTLVALALIIVGVLWFQKTDRLAYIIIVTLIASVASIIFYVLYINWGKFTLNVDMSFILTSYKSGIRVFISSLFIILLIRFDIVMIKHFLGYNQVGIYSIAAHLIDLLQMAANLVGGLLLVKLTNSDKEEEKWKIMKKLLMAFFVLLSVANIGFIVLGKTLIMLFYGRAFTPVYYVFLWLIPSSFGLSFGSLFNMYQNSKGFPIVSIILPAISVAVNILLNLKLIPALGITGAALSTSVAYMLWFILIIAYEQRESNNRMLSYLIPVGKDWVSLWRESLSILNGWKTRIKSHI